MSDDVHMSRKTVGLIKAVAWSSSEYELRTVNGDHQVCGPADKDDAELIERLWNSHVRAVALAEKELVK